jgi:hypothetical protein
LATNKDYLHPNWQKKRLEILERDNFSCVECDEKDKTLHVHHQYYIKGNKIWDYPNESLITLCCDCHEYEHSEEGKAFNKEFYINVLGHNLNTEYVNHFVSTMRLSENPRHARAFVDTMDMCWDKEFIKAFESFLISFATSKETPFKSCPLMRYREEYGN